MKDKILKFLSRYINMVDITDETDFFSEKLVNSLFYMQLILFLESEFDIAVENDEINRMNFNTVQSIVNFLEKK